MKDKSEGFMVDGAEQDNGIIELTQVVGKTASDMSDQDVIELTDVDTQADHEQMGLDLAFDALPEGIDEMPGPVIPPAKVSDLASAVTREQVDAALERVIEKKFEQRIEKILFEVMEKVLAKEIVDIRKCLQKDLDDLSAS